MADLDLRPLSLGEILDRTFSLYRGHFVLFVGITAVPQLLLLVYNLVTTEGLRGSNRGVIGAARVAPGAVSPIALVAGLLAIAFYLVVYIFVQGGTVFAVSELYLGHAASIVASLRRMRGHFWNLAGVSILNGLVVGVCTILLVIPGIYMACRLITCVPAALLEDLGPGDSLSRSLSLTKNEAGRSFVIYVLYFVLLLVALFLLQFPFTVGAGLTAKDPGAALAWTRAAQVGNFLAAVLVTPILTIATAVFYYDLRVRKEAFDLQIMMSPSGVVPSGAAGVGRVLT